MDKQILPLRGKTTTLSPWDLVLTCYCGVKVICKLFGKEKQHTLDR